MDKCLQFFESEEIKIAQFPEMMRMVTCVGSSFDQLFVYNDFYDHAPGCQQVRVEKVSVLVEFFVRREICLMCFREIYEPIMMV